MCDKLFNTRIKEIRDATKQLNRLYVRLRRIAILSLALSIVFVILLSLKYKLNGFDISARFIQPLNIFFLLGIIGLTIIIQIRQGVFRPCLRKFNGIYKATLELCNEVVDTSDWSSLRKRELSDNKRILVKETVDEFYRIRERHFFPGKTEKSVLYCIIIWDRLFQLMLMLELVLYWAYGLYRDLF